MSLDIKDKITLAIDSKPIGLCDLHTHLKAQGHKMPEICEAFSQLYQDKKIGLGNNLITSCGGNSTCRQLIIINQE